MRAMAASINHFMDAEDNSFDSGGRDVRSVSTLRLEFFATQSSGCINRLVAKALDAWGVDDLEVLGKSSFCCLEDVHNFPSHGLCNDPHKSPLRTLKLAGCVIPALGGFNALTTLVMQDLPGSTPASAYEDVFTLCSQLQSVHLKSCLCKGAMVVDAPRSGIKQLVIEHCLTTDISLQALPMLECLAVVDTAVSYKLSSFPHIFQLNVTQYDGIKQRLMSYFKLDWDLELYLGGDPGVISLVICFAGYDGWFRRWSPTLLLPKLRRVLIADVPSSGSVTCPGLLIKVAPCLETLHVHITTPWEEEPCDDISWQPLEFSHNQLKELVIVGFEGTKRQICFVKFVMKVAAALQYVSLYRKGRVQSRGHWDWDIVAEQYQWDNEEKANILDQITANVSCSETLIKVVLE